MDLLAVRYSGVFIVSLWSMLLLSMLELVSPIFVVDRAMMSLLSNTMSKQRYTPKISNAFQKEYDYIVVGAGSAGSVVASRLSEIPCVNVLLLEAGGHPPLLTEVPALSLLFWFTDVDWQFRTVPLKNTGSGLVNRQMPLPRGKMLGGSSSINALLYVRGNRKNYDDWAAQGAKGWSYREVFPYFLKLEDNRDPKFLANGYHNITGPVTVHQPRYQPLLKRYLRESITELGHKIIDSNGKRQLGFYDLQGFTRNGQRCSTAKAYLVPAENRKNLDIVINAMVKKVLIHKRQAVGVEFDFGGQTYRVKARREVIVSAGTFQTPQLLMLSGIGPKEELRKHKIPVIADLPVGRNFQDHAATLMIYELGPQVPSIVKTFLNPKSLVQYLKNRGGIFSALTFLQYLAWFKGNSTSTPIDFPSYELYLGEITTAPPAARYYGLRQEVFDTLFGPYTLKPLLLCLVEQTQPRSRGTITLNSTNIYDMPLIDPNYLDNILDEDDMIEGMKSCDRIALSRSMRKAGTKPLNTVIPGCEPYVNDLDSYYRCQLRSVLISAHHPSGSSKMGNPNDPTTVVDPQLRVKTIKGLRVVDASIMPIIVSGNLNAPTIMIAEKASDMIKETISCHRSEAGENEKAEYESSSTGQQDDWENQSSLGGSYDYPRYPRTEHESTSPEKQNVWMKQSSLDGSSNYPDSMGVGYKSTLSEKEDDWEKQSLLDSSFDYPKSPLNISSGSSFSRQRKILLKNLPGNRKFTRSYNRARRKQLPKDYLVKF